MFPRFDVISQARALLHACLPRSRYVTLRHDRSAADSWRPARLSRRLHLKSKRTRRRRMGGTKIGGGDRPASPFIDHWTIRFESRLIATKYLYQLVNIHDVIKFTFFFFSRIENTPWDIKWDIKVRICCGDCSDARWRVICICVQYFSFFLIDDSIRRYICKIYPNREWKMTVGLKKEKNR